MIETDFLVLGAGLAGLSTAHHLRKLGAGDRVLVVEKEARPGGRAGTIEKDGFLFDHTGHLLHLHDPYGKSLIEGLLRGNLETRERSAWIQSQGVFTRYPFQANTRGLPEATVVECVAGFLKNVHRPPKPGDGSFKDWCLRTFGEGICRRFMFPYNEKLWRYPLERMTTEWQGRFLPEPRAGEVLRGALLDQREGFGYNATFRYPKRGGIQALPDALAARTPGLRLNAAVERIDLAERVAVVAGLGEVRYRRLVNTLPLPVFLDLASPLPADVRAARSRLRWISVYNLNIGVARPRVSDKHWIYFPERKFPFYRAGFNSNFSSAVAPRGTSSMYIEVSAKPGERFDRTRLENRCIESLRGCGILKASDRIATRLWIDIPCAYVIYDRERGPALAAIRRHLGARGVETIGRWGAWKYSFMEEAVLDGRDCAERLLGKGPRAPRAEARGKLTALK
ncbi:MAG TPA: FAD-dependent oxidoreductase [Elusimicrobiota bacterium]|nr:FAD-dependent oxidoreductase [Elusimicrobiota bacterium]